MNLESYEKLRAALTPHRFDFASLNTLARKEDLNLHLTTTRRSAAKDANAQLDGMESI